MDRAYFWLSKIYKNVRDKEETVLNVTAMQLIILHRRISRKDNILKGNMYWCIHMDQYEVVADRFHWKYIGNYTTEVVPTIHKYMEYHKLSINFQFVISLLGYKLNFDNRSYVILKYYAFHFSKHPDKVIVLVLLFYLYI